MPIGTQLWALQPIVMNDEQDFVVLKHSRLCPLPLPTTNIRSPKTKIKINGEDHLFLLDTGAEVSILPKHFLTTLTYNHPHRIDTYSVKAFGGNTIIIEGPYHFYITICAVSFMQTFYVLDGSSSFIAGFDLIHNAQLVIDPIHNCLWSYLSAPATVRSAVSNYISSTAPVPPASGMRSHQRLEDQLPEANRLSDTPSAVASSLDDRTPSSNALILSLSSGPCATLSGPRASFVPDSQSVLPLEHGHHSMFSQDVDLVPPASTAIQALLPPDFRVFGHIHMIAPTSATLPDHLQQLFQTTCANQSLSFDIVAGIHDLLLKHTDTFASCSTDLGFCNILQHDIDTADTHPIKQSPRRPPLVAREAEDQILDEMLASGVIEHSQSPWASPVCLVKKKDNTYRFCVDYRRVNAVSRKDAFPIPDIQDALDYLRGAKYFATFDLLSGYWQLGMTERAKEASAFCTRRGLFHFTRMPFGLAGAPATFCRLMSIVLRDQLWKICLCYLDDIVVYAKTPNELLQRLHQVLTRLHEVGLKIKPTKSVLFQTEIQFLGHTVSVHGISPQTEKLDVIQSWPTPHCLRDVRAFVGLASYYRRFVKGFATIAEPLTCLTRKNTPFRWSNEADESFCKLKRALHDAVTLTFPTPGIPCILDTDASDVAIGAVLSQVINGVEHPIAFYSRVLNSTQKNYCPTRRELLAVIASLQHFRHYLLGSHVILRTDHYSLKWLKTFKRPEGILARWIETLSEFDYEIEHRPGRLHCNADGVSRPICKQCWGKTPPLHWIDECERADELTGPLGINAIFLDPVIPKSELQQLQETDPAIAPLLQFLNHDITPNKNDLRALPLEARSLWSQRPNIKIQDNILVRLTNNGTQLVVPYCLQKQLFDSVHSGPIAAHLGSDRMTSQLRQNYYWPGMKKDIFNWCIACEACATSKGPPSRPHGQLQKVLTAAPLDIVAIDILSGLPTATDNSKYILVLTDYFTKWSEAYALPDSEASTCMSAMYQNFFSRFGLPRQLHSDQGRNFESKLFFQLCKITGIEKSHTTPFHPRSDGQCERLNRTLLQMLRTTAADHESNWPAYLPSIMSAYRMTVHSVTGVTPNMAMLGREVLTPVTLIAEPPDADIVLTVPYVQTFRQIFREAHQRIRNATRYAAKTQKNYFDKFVKGSPLHVNQLVWLYWPQPLVRHRKRKLQRLWTGPWRVHHFVSPIVVKITHVYSGKQQTVHVDRLTPCHSQTLPVQEPPSTPMSPPISPIPPLQRQEHQDTTTPSTPTSTPAPRKSTRTRRSPKFLDQFVPE